MALPDDYKNMTLEELENYIEGFLSAKYGEEVRDNFARIAYLLGQHVESTGADATSAESAKNTVVEKAQEAAESAENAQTSAANAENYYRSILGAGVLAQSMPAEEYAALDPVSPKTLYVVEESGPDNDLIAYYPLTQNLQDALNPNQTATAHGCKGLGEWNGKCFDTSPASGTVGMHQNYIALPNDLFTGFDFANGVTVVLDVKPNAACSAGNGDWVRLMQFFKHANAPSGSEGEGDFYLSQGLIATAAYNGMTSQYLDASKAALVTSDRWHTVVMTLGGGFLSVYLDGSLVGQQLDTSNLLSQLNNFSQNYIGNSIRQDNDFAGLVKNFRVYNRALQQSELSKIGIGGKARLYWGGTLLVQSITTDQSELQNNQETE